MSNYVYTLTVQNCEYYSAWNIMVEKKESNLIKAGASVDNYGRSLWWVNCHIFVNNINEWYVDGLSVTQHEYNKKFKQCFKNIK